MSSSPAPIDPLDPPCSLEAIEITPELNRRPCKPPDYEAENRAIRLFLHEIAADPGNLFHALADIVLELCKAGSAGVSLVEPTTEESGQGVLRWVAVAGAYSQYMGGCVPLNRGPCGITLQRIAPVLLARPEQRFTFLGNAETRIAEGLMVPMIMESNPIGTLWIASHDEQRKFDAEDLRIMNDLAGIATAAYQMNKAVLAVESERKAQQKQEDARLQASLQEKELLLEEIHHRVKNNLNVISSLLAIQSGYVRDSVVSNMFDDLQDRVRAIAGLHETLYTSRDLRNIQFGPYLEELAKGLFRSYGVRTEHIELRIETADVVLSTEQAMPLGLIANELVCNALKHAFPGRRTGRVTVCVRYVSEDLQRGETLDEGSCELIVSDNGVGLGGSLERGGSMGMRLVRLLVSQLRGEISTELDQGTTFRLRFPLR